MYSKFWHKQLPPYKETGSTDIKYGEVLPSVAKKVTSEALSKA